jgi:hypothetical protein
MERERDFHALIITPGQQQMRIRREGKRVLLFMNGQLVFDAPYDAALEIAKGITAQARLIEEEVKAEQIIADEAILARSGFPVGLTTRKDLAEAAAKHAAWDSQLRRYIRQSRFEQRGIVFAPNVEREGD